MAVRLASSVAMSTVTSKQIVQKPPRVGAFKLAIDIAQEQMERGDEEAEAYYTSLTEWLMRVELCNLLELNNYPDMVSKYIQDTEEQLVAQDVLHELYTEKKITGLLLDQVATLLKVSPHEARQSLLLQSIQSPDAGASQQCGKLLEQSTDPSQLAEDLIQLAYSADMSTSTATRCHALGAVLRCCHRLENLSIPVDALQHRHTMCRQMMVLEGLDVTVTADELESCSKVGLLKSLWKDQMHLMGTEQGHTVALKLAQLALELKVGDSSIWGELLGTLQPSTELLQTIAGLVRLRRPACVQGKIKHLLPLWQKAVAAPLEQLMSQAAAPTKLTPEHREGITIALQQLGSSPLASVVAVSLDTEKLVVLLLQAAEVKRVLSCSCKDSSMVCLQPDLAMQCTLCAADSARENCLRPGPITEACLSVGREAAMRALLSQASADMLPTLLAQLPAASDLTHLIGLQHLTVLVYGHAHSNR